MLLKEELGGVRQYRINIENIGDTDLKKNFRFIRNENLLKKNSK